MKRPVFELQLS